MYELVHFNNYFTICMVVIITKSTEKEKKSGANGLKHNQIIVTNSLIALPMINV